VLFMRGATTDLKLVLLDGAPVYAPFHVGGLLPTFDPNVMGTASHYVGGAPARYDGGLSYILDLSTRAPGRERVSSSGSVDLLSARASVDGPLGRSGGFLVGARALHRGAGHLLPAGAVPYGYGDALARVEVGLTPGHSLSATGFMNRESVLLDFPGATGTRSAPRDASWGNRAVSLTYRGRIGATRTALRGAAGRYDASLPISRADGDLFAWGASGRMRLTVDVVSPLGKTEIRYGVSAERVETTYEGRTLGGAGGIVLEDAADGEVVGGYAEAVVPVSNQVRLWAGLRLDRFSSDGTLRPAPRLRLAWLLSDQAVLSLAVGRYHQYARVSDEGVQGTLAGVVPEGSGLSLADPLLSVARSSHLVVSLDQMLLPKVRLGLDGYVKAFEGVSTPGQRLNASGADLRVSHVSPSATVWLGYSLAWYWSQDGLGYTTERFAGQQLLSLGASGRAWSRLGLDLRLAYGDGLPLTAVQLSDAADEAAGPGPVLDVDGGTNRELPIWSGGARADQFLRLDLEVSGTFDARIGGRPVLLRPYLRVMNALGRRDALFYYFEPWRSPDAQPLMESALLPVVGVEWRF
jgi:hypothetical protein